MSITIEELERTADEEEALASALALTAEEQTEIGDRDTPVGDVVTAPDVPDHRIITADEAATLARGTRGDHVAAQLEAEAREGVAAFDGWTRENERAA